MNWHVFEIFLNQLSLFVRGTAHRRMNCNCSSNALMVVVFPWNGGAILKMIVLTDQTNKTKMGTLVSRKWNVQKEQFVVTTPRNAFQYNMLVMEIMIVEISLMKINAFAKMVNVHNVVLRNSNVKTIDAFPNNGVAIQIMIVVMEVMKSLNFVTMLPVLLVNLLVRMVDVFLFIGFAMGIMIVMMQLMKIHNAVLHYNVAQINSDVPAVANAYHLQIIAIHKMIATMLLMRKVVRHEKATALLTNLSVLLLVFVFQRHGNVMGKKTVTMQAMNHVRLANFNIPHVLKIISAVQTVDAFFRLGFAIL